MAKEIEGGPFINYYILLRMPMSSSATELQRKATELLTAEKAKLTTLQETKALEKKAHPFFAHPEVTHAAQEKMTRTIELLTAAQMAFSSQEKKAETDAALFGKIEEIHKNAEDPAIDYYHLLNIKSNILAGPVENEFKARLQALTLTKENMALDPDKERYIHMIDAITAMAYQKVWPIFTDSEEKARYDEKLKSAPAMSSQTSSHRGGL